MTANQAMFPIHAMCNAFGVSRSGYYAWVGRRPSARAAADAVLVERIRAIHKVSKETYGAPRIHAELTDEGVYVARKRVARLMKTAAIAGVSRRRGVRTTFRDNRVRPACDLVDRNFYANAPDTLWVADITYVPTWAGFLYLAVVLDAFSRRIVGWAMGHDLKAQLVLDALNMALAQRRPVSVIHHSDQGSQLELELPRFDGHNPSCERRVSPCREREILTRRSSGSRSLPCRVRVAASRIWRVSSSRARRRSMAGSSRPNVMAAAAMTV
jgi:putative transposase